MGKDRFRFQVKFGKDVNYFLSCTYNDSLWTTIILKEDDDVREIIKVLQSYLDNKEKMHHLVGDTVILKRAMLGNPIGAKGYVFDTYPAFNDELGVGVQIIFPNGQYDGFSPEEQGFYLDFVGHDTRYSGYEFKGVMWVSQAYRGGYWSFE